MDDSPPPAYSKEHKRPVVINIPPAASRDNLDRTETLTASKRTQGGDSFPRPLPRLPGGESSSSKPGTVSPLRVHKKSQSAAIPSIERPWKPPNFDGGPSHNKRWDPTVPNPQFRHREAELAPPPVSSHHKYGGRPAPPPIPMEEYGRRGHFQTSVPSRGDGRAIHAGAKKVATMPADRMPQLAVDANSFYNPAVSGYLTRPHIRNPDTHP
ncbi:hypothetical protein DFH09DRAFT_22491 [Mycena vulgaris]|nr:hypothetical protein DFH09DRAFT_22491 [Mycena vulgaris]